MTHHFMPGKGHRFGMFLTGLLLAGSVYAGSNLGFAQTETGSFLEFTGEQQVFHTAAELDGRQASVATVSNPFSDRSISVQVRAITTAAAARTVAVELAADDSVSFDLQAGAVHVLATSASMFQLELHDEGGLGKALPVERVRTGRNPRTNKAAGGNANGFGGGGSSTVTRCDEDWTLTCDSPGCAGLGPFTHPGRVDQDIIWIGGRPVVLLNEVYWNLNTPIGNYKTQAPGGLTADWVPGSGYCPVEVTNSLGHTYTVTR